MNLDSLQRGQKRSDPRPQNLVILLQVVAHHSRISREHCGCPEVFWLPAQLWANKNPAWESTDNLESVGLRGNRCPALLDVFHNGSKGDSSFFLENGHETSDALGQIYADGRDELVDVLAEVSMLAVKHEMDKLSEAHVLLWKLDYLLKHRHG